MQVGDPEIGRVLLKCGQNEQTSGAVSGVGGKKGNDAGGGGG